MKKITLILLAVFFCQITLANETDSILSKARNLVHDKNYTEAIKVYKSYIEKNYENEIKDVYVELANCYFNSNDKKSAIKYIKEAITKQGFTEEDFELEEGKSHLKRSLVQCIRDIRQSGSITKGEQEYLEQIGVNPSKMQMRIREYVQDEATADTWDASLLHEFVNNVTNELIDNLQVDKVKMDLMGFKHEHNPELTHKPEVAKKLENKTDV